MVLWYLLVVVEVLVSMLLIFVILLQRSKSQGMGIALGGQMGEQLFGSQMGNVLTRATVVLGIIFFVNTTLLAYLSAGRRTTSIVDKIPSASGRPAAAAPVTPGPLNLPAPSTPAAAPMAAPSAPVAIPAPVVVDQPAAAPAGDAAK
jgi:preprotein translocase subunit SecG